MLREKRLPLLDPRRWDDKNDARYLEIYKKKKNLKSVLAICIADAPETYQHWKIYAGNTSGVCIEFQKGELINSANTRGDIRHDYVEYVLLDELHHNLPSEDDLPFIKRFAYQDEREYRFVYTSDKEEKEIEYISIVPTDIKQIIINPWAEKPIYQAMRQSIIETKDWEKVKIRHSTVTKNDEWGRLGEKAVKGERRYRNGTFPL
jgi:hypothetical protein